MTTHDQEFDLDESVSDAIPSVDGPVASFQPPRPATSPERSSGERERASGERASSGERADDLQRTADKRAAEMREAAAQAAARLRTPPSPGSNHDRPALPGSPPKLDVESPFLELFDASAHSPESVKVSGPPPVQQRPPRPPQFTPPPPPPPAPFAGTVAPVSAVPMPVPVSAVPVSAVPVSARPVSVVPRHHREEPARPAKVKPVKAPKQPKDRGAAQELAITEIAGHLTFTPHAVTAWYLLPEVRWAFRPDPEREALLSAISEQYAGLAGFRLHLRRTTRPFPADLWAAQLDQLTTRPLPAVPNAPSWADHLVGAQKHLRQVNHSEGQTFLGVTFARRALGDNMSERLLKMFGKGTPESERKKLGRQVEQFDEVLAAFGMRGQRAHAAELEWLLYRSVALGMAPPTMLGTVAHGQWEDGDLLALTENIERYRTPYGSTVKLVNRLTGEERHVAVLTVGRMVSRACSCRKAMS